MPKESSAIEELVSLAQQKGYRPEQPGIQAPGAEPANPFEQGNPFEQPGAGLAQAASSAPRAKPNRGGLWIVLLGLVAIGGAVLGGYVLARQESGEPAQGMGQTADKGSPLETKKVPLLPPKPAVAATAPQPDAAVEDEEIVPDESQSEEDTSDTGFDIFVEPKGAKITVDGYPIGSAPLRVRNLNPGKHSIAIEGLPGYFGKHLDLELAKGQAEVLRIELEAVDPELVAAAVKTEETTPGFEVASIDEGGSDTEESKPTEKLTRREKKRLEQKEKRRKKREERRKAEAAAAASSTPAEEAGSAEKVGLGTLMLGAKPPCKIIIDGKNTGLTTPQRSIQLPEGRHTVILVNDDHKIRKRLKIVIKAGRTTKAIQDLTKLMK